LHNKIFPPAPENCNKPISRFNKIIIAVNTDNLMTVDTGLGGNYRASIKSTVADALEKRLRNKFNDAIELHQLTIAEKIECDIQSVMIEGDITYIKTYLTMGAFVPVKQRHSGELKAKIKICSSGDVLSARTISNSDDDFQDMVKDLGEKLGSFAHDKLTTCQ
jgi:hypothetical protein